MEVTTHFIRRRPIRVWAAILLISIAFRAVAAPERLSTNALAEIAALYQEKVSWTPAQCKMESQLIHAWKKHRGQTFAPGAPNLQLDVKMQADGRILVDIQATVTPALLQLITTNGGQIISQVPQFNAIRALVTLDELETLANSADVRNLRRAAEAHHNTGSVDSEGDTTHQALTARAVFGVNGAGVNVGVLSDSEDFLAEAQSTGDLGPVTVLSGQSGETSTSTGEGTAMMEIVHDLAPGSPLFFATADGGPAVFAQNILNLRAAGCDILVDDTGYFNESPFQDGLVAQAVNTVTDNGALYFSSAGNSGNFDSGTSGTWEGDFVDGGAAAAPITEAGRLHSFGSLNYDTAASGGSELRVDLFWSDPLGAATDDYDLFVLDSTGTTFVNSSMTRQNGSQDPYESISSLKAGQRIVIVKFSGNARFLHLSTGRGRLSINTPGSTLGHSAATNAFSIAAVDVATAYPNSFTGGAANPVETFSADGPRHVFFNSDGSAITPGNLSSTGGAIRQKPDLAAADGVSTSLSGFSPFFGTSAAAPHAASIAALVKSFNPAISSAQMRSILTSTALDIMATGVDRDAGYGIVMANTALPAANPDSLAISPRTGFVASGPVGGPFNVTSQTFSLTNAGTGSLTWTLSNTSAWLNASPTSGTLTPGGSSTTVTVSLTAASSNLVAGAYTVNLAFTNLTTHFLQTRLVTLFVEPVSTYASAVLALQPVAYWRLNETNPPPPAAVASNSGSLGGFGTGFEANGVIPAQPGIVGTSFRFTDPSLTVTYLGSHVDVPYTSALNPNGPFTVELWANPAQITSDFFCPAAALDANENNTASRNGWIFYESAGSVWQFRVGGLNGYAATLQGGTVQTNTWQHLVGVYDGVNASFYVNGVLAAGPSSAAGFSPNTTQPFRIGATTIPNRTFDGSVDEVAFYTNALSASVIASHYNTALNSKSTYGSLVLSSQPVGYWHLDDPAAVIPNATNFPVAVNIGTLAPNGNGTYEPGTFPGTQGVPNVGFGATNLACLFVGQGNIDIPTNSLNFTGPLSLVAWTKASPNLSGNSESVLDKGSGSYRLLLDGSGRPHFADGTQPSGDVIGSTRLDDGQWHLLVGVFDGASQQTLYVDGQVAASVANATTAIAGTGDDLWIGGDPATNAFQFNGVIDEVAIFNSALSPSQVSQLFFSATNNPSVTPPRLSTVVSRNTATNTVTFTFNTTIGRMYQIQFKTNLTQATWSNLSSPLTAASPITTIAEPIGPTAQQFYRIILLP